MKFIEHYTDEGDIIFDGFCGTGMTGVAAQLLNRKAILSDLSPAATFIAYNYNTPVDVNEFEREAKRILAEVEKECGWMYETLHADGRTKGKINYTIWSDVFICPYCDQEHVFWETAVDKENGKVNTEYACPHCNAIIKKTDCERSKITYFDTAIDQQVTQAKQVPVLINYTAGKKRYEKVPDESDLILIKKIEESAIPYWFPINRMPEGYNTKQPRVSHGITHVHHFYTKRNLYIISKIMNNAKNAHLDIFVFGNLNTSWHATIMRRFNPRGGDRPLSGTYYVPSIPTEGNMIDVYAHKIKQLNRFIQVRGEIEDNIILSQSTSNLSNILSNSTDYIFTDPPFGGNLMYSELNFLWESWLKVFTNNTPEAIINTTQLKGLPEYKELMVFCFKEMYRILKPNRWITVEFHNSKASVWNAIQDALTKSICMECNSGCPYKSRIYCCTGHGS